MPRNNDYRVINKRIIPGVPGNRLNIAIRLVQSRPDFGAGASYPGGYIFIENGFFFIFFIVCVMCHTEPHKTNIPHPAVFCL
jgi:hypothetical protein